LSVEGLLLASAHLDTGRSCHHRQVSSSPRIEQGLAALRAGDAASARRAFESALAEVESGEVLEGLAEALYLEREYAAAADHYERAYSAYRRERDNLAAGRAARMVAWITGSVFGDWAVQSGWFARARTILEEAGEDRREHGWVLTMRSFSEPDAQVREALLREAIALGRRFGDPNIEFEALAYLGCLLTMTDRAEQGLAFLDEALAAACAGELTDLAVVTEHARVVVGADGRHSLVARAVGPEQYNEKPQLLCGYYTYWSGLPMNGRFETYVRPDRGFAAWPTPECCHRPSSSPRRTSVASCRRPPRRRRTPDRLPQSPASWLVACRPALVVWRRKSAMRSSWSSG